MAESILVTGKKISSMELVTNVTGNEKIPTGQPDDLAVTPNQIADHTIARGDLASQEDLSQVEVSLGTQITDLAGDLSAEEAARIAADNLKVDKDGSVSSVAGRVGDVVLAPSDVLVEGFGSQEDVNKYVPKPFLSGYTYGLGERVVLNGGEVVKNLVNGNLGNPNVDMTGWVSTVSDSLSDTVQTFNTTEAGIDPVTGVADGAYFNVRSSSDETYVDEYQNIGGVATVTGKRYLSALGVAQQEKDASTIKDASGFNQQEVNNFTVNVLQFIKPEDVNDTESWQRAAAEIVRRGGGKIIIPNIGRDYVVGKQTFLGSDLGWKAEPIMEFIGLGNVIIEGHGVKVRLADGLRFGGFDPATGNALTAPIVLSSANKKYICNAPIPIKAHFNNLFVCTGVELDGNQDNYNLGGQVGVLNGEGRGYQIEGYGIWAVGNKRQSLGNCIADNFGTDGFYVGSTNTYVNPEYYKNSEFLPSLMTNCHARKNGRQGLSFTGGAGFMAMNCTFKQTGKGRIFSYPAAGVDVEAETGVIRNALFLNCEMSDNAREAFAGTTGDGQGVTFEKCRLIGTTWRAITLGAKKYQFKSCKIIGGTLFNSGTSIEGELSKFIECEFTDDVSESPTGQVTGYDNALIAETNSIGGHTGKTIFDKCVFNITQLAWARLYTGAHEMNDCRLLVRGVNMSNISGDQIGYLLNVKMKDFKAFDLRSNQTQVLRIFQPNAATMHSSNYVDVSGNIQWQGYVAGKGYQTNEDPLSTASRSLSLAKIDVGAAIDRASYVSRVFANGQVPTQPTAKGNPFNIGDRIENSAVNNTAAAQWVCTVSGYSCEVAWMVSTAVTLNSYIYHNSNVYKVTSAGTTGTTAPTHSTGSTSNGTATLEYFGSRAIFRPVGAKGVAVANATGTDDTAVKLNALIQSLRDAGVIL